MQKKYLRIKGGAYISYKIVKETPLKNWPKLIFKDWGFLSWELYYTLGNNPGKVKSRKAIYFKDMGILTGLKRCLKYSLVKINNQ